VFEYVAADVVELTMTEVTILRKLGTIAFHPGLHAVLLYRMARWFQLHRMWPIAIVIGYLSTFLTGAQISARADIGKGFVIYHPHGMVIGPTIIGEYCTLSHNNLIGQLHGDGDRPIIGNYFFAATGAKIMGRIQIGDKVRVGPNTVVTDSLADGVIFAGNPAKGIRRPGTHS
jgi:serine O-acetyltransferase